MCSSAGPVVPIGKNNSGSVFKQAARNRQLASGIAMVGNAILEAHMIPGER